MNRVGKPLLCLAAAGCLALLMPSLVHAQVLGTIQGYITDQTNNDPIPGVTVVVHNTGTGAERTVITDSAGFYKASALQSGDYSVTGSLEGLQTTRQDNVQLLVAQRIDINLKMGVAAEAEVITVTSEAPLVEVSRSSAASYVGEQEIEALPISGRDFTDLAFLTPTVIRDTVRGFVTMSGQRGIYSGLNIDGTDAKSAFFAYGRGGEATENDGLVVAQDSVKEFQVIVNGFAPEYGANGGGYINVITKSGTNALKGNAFFFTRDEGLSEDLPRSPLDQFFGNTEDIPVEEFSRDNFGGSIGGPIRKDRTHFFFSVDQVERDEPATRSLNPGTYDALLLRAQADSAFQPLLNGWVPNNDGVAAPDAENGRTALNLFNRQVDNQILFGKIDHQFNNSNTGTFRVNFTDFERVSGFQDEESLKTEDTLSFVAQLVSVIGSDKINEARIQIADDNLDRLSERVNQAITGEINIDESDDTVGKADFLPIFVEEAKTQIQDNFSYLFGSHDLKFGVDYQEDDLKQLFAGRRDGEYFFDTLQDFIDNNAESVEIFFGDVTFPNYDEVQEIFGVYAQDSWKPRANLSINYGVRFSGTMNPDNLPHLFPEGRDIPDDTDNIAPRIGFAYTPDAAGKSVVRGGVGLFFGRTPSLVFASQVQENGLFPNAGRVGVEPGEVGFVELGQPINNESPPLGIAVAAGFVAPDYEDAETTRLNLGYERQIGGDWSAGVDVVYAEGDNLLENIDINRTFTTDEFGRPIFSGNRPLTTPDGNPLAEVLTRRSIGESEYTAVTLRLNKRFSGRYQVQAHYTWSEDEDTSSNERSATSVTLLRSDDPRFDFGPSERDIENRFVVSGLVELPLGFTLSGIYEFRDGRPFNPVDTGDDFVFCAFFSLGFDCPDIRPVANGQVLGRNSFRNDSYDRLDIRVGKMFRFGDRYRVDIFLEVFNVFDEDAFEVDDSFRGDQQRDPTNDRFGLASERVLDQRQMQIGARFTF